VPPTRVGDLELELLGGTAGAVVLGVDPRRVDAATVSTLRDVLVAHKVVVFRGARLEPAELVAFARRFGDLTVAHPVMPGLPDQPEVLEIDATKSREDPRYRDEYENDTWHTDVTFMEVPPLGSMLSARVLPPVGGDTVFADMEAAYAALSAPMQRLLDSLDAVHDGRTEFARFLETNPDGGVWEGRRFTVLEPVVHPVVRTHPESGRRSLFVNPTFTSHILEMSRSESDAVLQFLYQHAIAQEHLVRIHWNVGDVVFWDNRATMHYAVRDYGDAARVMQRVTVRGDRPV
jgi:alpha-ketoglutarate-dependent taurine dioxygenase